MSGLRDAECARDCAHTVLLQGSDPTSRAASGSPNVNRAGFLAGGAA
jgi:hypothetical protein